MAVSKKVRRKRVRVGVYSHLFDMKLDVALKGQPPYLKDHLKQYMSLKKMP